MRPMLLISAIIILLAAGCGSSSPTGPDTSGYYSLTVTLADDHARPVRDATVVMNPGSRTALTDSLGVARFDSLPGNTSSMVVEREYYADYTGAITSDILASGIHSVTLTTRGPVITILSPANNAVLTSPMVHFTAEGIDPEDGDLSQEMIWRSNVSGELGEGPDVTAELFANGNHIITCKAVDTDGNADSTQVTIMMNLPVDNETYFPLMQSMWWQYRHPTQTYFVTREDGFTEGWTLDDLRVAIDTQNRRTTTLGIRYTLGTTTKYYDYTVVDQLRGEGDAFYVTGTTETMIMRENSPNNPVFFRAVVTTDYSPDYLLIPDVYDPAAIPSYDTTVRTDLDWLYNSPFDDEVHFTESLTVPAAVTVGEPESVTAPLGSVEAYPVTYTQGDTHKTWWLAQGIGIVKMEYMSYAVPTVAVLEFTSFTQKPAMQPVTPAYREITGSTAGPQPSGNSGSRSADTGVPEFRRLREVARAFLPR